MGLGLVVDIGNTNTRVLCFDVEEVKDMSSSISRFETIDLDSHKIEHVFLSYLKELDVDKENIQGVLISSVVPEANKVFESSCINTLGLRPAFLNCSVDSGLKFALQNTETLGADRIANVVGGLNKLKSEKKNAQGKGVLVVDVGTGTTWDVASPEQEFLGGAIFAGPVTSLDGLFRKSSKISKIELFPPTNVLGKSTQEALMSGVFYGYAGMIDALIRRIKESVSFDVICYATGGLADLICDFCEEDLVVDTQLTMRGLKTVFQRIQRKK